MRMSLISQGACEKAGADVSLDRFSAAYSPLTDRGCCNKHQILTVLKVSIVFIHFSFAD
jgi:hypothetical protein